MKQYSGNMDELTEEVRKRIKEFLKLKGGRNFRNTNDLIDSQDYTEYNNDLNKAESMTDWGGFLEL
jgi:CHASE1-domain containing sensor protein